ncbi:MAG: asparagine synthetase B [Flavobacteriaceae bacterium]|nr:asparagine synthetase B [Flavobacteriaceae bacterium]|tara:strand:- start:44757 stop:45311 length:555 start_codon:yes stop_codon:yes gene_type:complete
MKKILFILAVVSFITAGNQTLNAQDFPKMDVSPMDAATFPVNPKNWRNSNKMVKVVYSRPQLKGRSMDKLAPKGKVWRTGANEAAEITFYQDVVFGGANVKAGTYSLFSIPNDGKWTVILSNQINLWGAYQYDQSGDVVRVEGTVSSLDTSVEAFAMLFTGEGTTPTFHMAWGTTLVSVPMSAQ